MRHPRIADLVDLVAAKLAAGRPALAPTKRVHTEWLAVAKLRDPADVRRLVDGLATSSTTQALERLRALTERDDPQLGVALLGLLRGSDKRWRSARELWEAIVDCVLQLHDLRVRDEIDAVLPLVGQAIDSSVGDDVYERLAAARATVPPAPPQLDADEARILAGLERELGTRPRARPRPLDELLAQVYAEPDADGPREVYADAVGGELGELIIAQLRSTEPPPDITQPRTQPQAAVPDRRALGPLADLAIDAILVRGFAEQLVIWRRTTGIDRHVGHPAWRLVTHLLVRASHNVSAFRTVQLLGHDVMSRVRVLGGLHVALVRELVARPILARVERLEVLLYPSDERGIADELASLPALRRLTLDGRHLWAPPRWIARLAGAAARCELAVQTQYLEAWFPALRALGARRFELGSYAAGRLTVEGDRLELAPEPRNPGDLIRIVTALAPHLAGIARVAVRASPPVHAELRAGLAGIAQRAGLHFLVED
ncbi:MAG: hypothetical protein KIT31_08405 [Deltaproteobacteria bacterium]|nr:hypothetical protein [Deltaproteobacteria bacterium]